MQELGGQLRPAAFTLYLLTASFVWLKTMETNERIRPSLIVSFVVSVKEQPRQCHCGHQPDHSCSDHKLSFWPRQVPGDDARWKIVCGDLLRSDLHN
ncbi:hypothetical protein BP00DRAFT_171280 [Aspergillus indologenus CBS 114.80]|uniref:Uncharacterized protein n=1 Tax=Aspergillus indologenus CBS 114.80 TaxID=1450541 RepID=A0A2V5JBH5_9EURO|nr:hypothetical protein BP00DRAFT_171280 [Aspergillus indologenus CBS 114.80]